MSVSKQLNRALIVAILALAVMATGLQAQAGTPHECNFCHVIHGAPGPTLTIAADSELVCLTCHGSELQKYSCETNNDR